MAWDSKREYFLRKQNFSLERWKEFKSKVQLRKKTNKEFGVKYLGGKCARCGGVFPPCVYDFHHIIPKKKTISGGFITHLGKKKMKEELDKCELLCANCHRIEHSKKGRTMNDVTKDTLPFDATHEMVDGKWVEKAKTETTVTPAVDETVTPVVI